MSKIGLEAETTGITSNIREQFITIDTLEFTSYTDGRISAVNTKTGTTVIESGYYLVDINPNAVVEYNDPQETKIITFMTGGKKIELIYTTKDGYIKYYEEATLSPQIKTEIRHIDKTFMGTGLKYNCSSKITASVASGPDIYLIRYIKEGTVIFDRESEKVVSETDFECSTSKVWFELSNSKDANNPDLGYYTKNGNKYSITVVYSPKEKGKWEYAPKDLCEIECDELLSVVGIQNKDQDQNVEITCIVKTGTKVRLIKITKNNQTKEQRITYSRDLGCDEVVQTTINPCTYLLKRQNGTGILTLDDDGKIKTYIEPLYGDVITYDIDGKIVYCVIDKKGYILCIKDNGDVIYGVSTEDAIHSVLLYQKEGYFIEKLKEKINKIDKRVQHLVEKKEFGTIEISIGDRRSEMCGAPIICSYKFGEQQLYCLLGENNESLLLVDGTPIYSCQEPLVINYDDRGLEIRESTTKSIKVESTETGVKITIIENDKEETYFLPEQTLSFLTTPLVKTPNEESTKKLVHAKKLINIT